MAYGNSAVAFVSRDGVLRADNRATLPRSTTRVSTPATSAIVRRLVVVSSTGSDARTPLIAVDPVTLEGYEIDYNDGLGFSLGKIVSNIGKTVAKAAKDTVKATTKAVVDTGHVAGAVVTSTAGKAILGGALALTGVGLPAAAGIMAATQAGGQLTKKGGNLGKAARGAVEGAAEGTVAGLAGKVLKNNAGGLVDTVRGKLGMGSFREPAPPAPEVDTSTRRTAVVGPVRGATTKGTPLKFKPVPDLTHGAPPAPLIDTVVSSLPPLSDVPPGPPRLSVVDTLVDDAKKAAAPVVPKKAGGGGRGGKSSGGSSILDSLKQQVESLVSGSGANSGGGGGGGGGYFPPSSPPSGGGDATPAPAQAGLLGGIPPMALVAGLGVVAFVMLNRRGR